MNPLRAEAVRTMYAQIPNTLFASVIITLYMVGVSLPFTPWPIVIGWAMLPMAFTLLRVWGLRRFRQAKPDDAAMGRWAAFYAVQQGLVGVVWGLCMILFVHQGEPLTVALTLCCLYSIAAGSVTSLAYYPPANLALIGVLYSTILVRMVVTGAFVYQLVGVTSALFGVTMIGYCRVQTRAVMEALRIRFENVELVRALAVEKAEADEARRRAETASLAKSQFLAAASHDLRQPLYALGLFSASLEQLRLDEEGRTIVARIGESIGAMESLFAGLLDVSRLEAGVVTPRLTAVSVDLLFDQLSQVFRPIARERGLDLRFRSDGEWIRSDAVLVEQVMSNLLANALRATHAGGVLVAARRRGDGVRLEVYDTGTGIAAADLQRIFDEFVQLGNPERDRRKGLGLGLSIARRAAALLGATIAVRSRAGRGSCFALVQPAGAQPGRLPATPVEPERALPRDRALPVLVVEDDADVRAALEQLLGRWGVRHDAVANAEAALARCAGQRYGLVISDQRLGDGMDGLTLLTQLIGGDAPPAAMLITGEFDPLLANRAQVVGVPVLTKPVRAERLRLLLGAMPASVHSDAASSRPAAAALLCD